MNLETFGIVADVLAKVTIVLLAGGLAAVAMGGATAARRHLVWLLACIAALAMPLLCATLPAWRVLPATAGHAATVDTRSFMAANGEPPRIDVPSFSSVNPPLPKTATHSPTLTASSTVPSSLAEPTVRTQTPPFQRIKLTLTAWISIVWAAGCLLLLTRLIVSWFLLRRVWSAALPIQSSAVAEVLAEARAEMNLCRPVEVRTSSRHAMPMTWGILRPVILLPMPANNWPLPRARLALLHELAHIKRRDSLAQLIGQLCCAFYWFHPFAWLAAAGLRREQERAADDRVLSLDSHDTDYASFLLELATRPGQRWFAGNAAIAMARPSAMEGRLRAILDVSRRKDSLSTQGAWVAVIIALAMVLPVAAIRGQAQSPEPATIPSTQPATSGEQYTGHVLSPDGKPVAGAEVFLQCYSSTRFVFEEVAITRTGNDGTFAFSVPPHDDKMPLPTSIQAWSQGFAPGRVIGSDVKNLTIRLLLPTTQRVVFIDHDNQPMPGLRVTPAWHSATLSNRLTKTTDAQGACVFDMLPRNSHLAFMIDDERFAMMSLAEYVQTGSGPESAPAWVPLMPAGSITGKVINSTLNATTAGIHILASGRGRSVGAELLDVPGGILTNDRGEYRISRLHEGDYSIRIAPRARENEDLGWTVGSLNEVHVSPGKTTADQNFVLVKGSIVHGRLYQAETGKGIPDATVATVDLPTKYRLATARTGADGSFEMRVPPGWQGIYLVTPPPDGLLAAGFDGLTPMLTTRDEDERPSHYYDIKAVDGQDISVGLKLTSKLGKPVSGRVVNADGKPAAGVEIQAREVENDRPNGTDPYFSVTTNTEGRFSFKAVAPGAELSVLQGKLGTLKPVKVNGGEQNVLLQLAKNLMTAVSGKVVDSTGKPLANVNLQLEAIWQTQRGVGFLPATLTDSAGKFTFPNLIPGAWYFVKVSSPGYLVQFVDLKFTPGAEHFDAGQIVMEKIPSAR